MTLYKNQNNAAGRLVGQESRAAFKCLFKECGSLERVAQALDKSFMTVYRWEKGGKMSPASRELIIRVWQDVRMGKKGRVRLPTPEQAFEILEGHKRDMGSWDKLSKSWGIPKKTMMRWAKVKRVLSQSYIELIDRKYLETP